MPTTDNGWTQPARTVQPTMHSPCKQSTSRTCRVRGGPRAMQMLKHPLKGAGSHPLTQAKSAQHCSATRRLPCKRAHITWPSGQHGRYSALVPCSNHMPHTFNTHSTHTLLSTHSTHTLPTLSPTHPKQTQRHQHKRNDLVQKHYRTAAGKLMKRRGAAVEQQRTIREQQSRRCLLQRMFVFVFCFVFCVSISKPAACRQTDHTV